jgi:D-arabinose 1-dehydrogenase-like Zn-dependent alcohol dehydrogenase
MTQNVAAELTKLGGARVVLATATDSKAMTATIGGLGIDGRLVVVGASTEPIEVPPLALIPGRRSIAGWPSGTASDSEDTLDFSVLAQIRPLIETYPLARAPEAFDRMLSGKARFRVVLTMDGA